MPSLFSLIFSILKLSSLALGLSISTKLVCPNIASPIVPHPALVITMSLAAM